MAGYSPSVHMHLSPLSINIHNTFISMQPSPLCRQVTQLFWRLRDILKQQFFAFCTHHPGRDHRMSQILCSVVLASRPVENKVEFRLCIFHFFLLLLSVMPTVIIFARRLSYTAVV